MGFRSFCTYKWAEEVIWIDSQGWKPIEDFSKRTAAGQHEQFLLGKSKCDGYKKISPHQYEGSPHCLAKDILIDDGTGNINNKDVYKKAHEHWIILGGDPMIEWDADHFQISEKKT